ncbi:MAG: primosomal protein N' [Sphingomonadales bacterium RIFCSPHIGHO2_01_FULL_65_20]|jgi:primosomal protein N' (replication factor Y)|uniref:primosomal protein N' n=1 Tax=unclassified Blastomonas TaxID=2626550 RepID=UPI00082F7736|nr:primosomal protein N' [Blastomonas sp.]OHC97703.1 MAG: primosomal protein N' [Sphingomonadales bacterium RIFCSPHIGHO2_01_FULL_65_20]
MTRVRVLLFNSAVGPFDYSVPQGMDLPVGSVVQVPLGPRRIDGIVWDAGAFGAEEIEASRLRPVLARYDMPPLSQALRRLIEWTADYYLASPAAVARMALPSGSLLGPGRSITEYRLTGEPPARMTPQRQQVYDRLAGEQATVRELAALAEVSEGVIRSLVTSGAFEAMEVPTDRPWPRPDPDHITPALNDEQQEAADRLAEAVRAAEPMPFLLDGVTGSGKTEVYFEAVAEALRKGRQTLLLLPEIALTQPFLTRIEARFGAAPVPWHSGLKQTERRRAWNAIISGEAKIVVGARSALFLPYANLGVIIVDEAHETSFKQEDGVRYNARDVAVMRGRFEGCPVVLSSATPALESRVMAETGRYEPLTLTHRYGGAQLPRIGLIDLTQNPPPRNQWIAPPLLEAMQERLARGEQSLLFLNRRGYAPLTLCRHCGHRFKCPNCSAWMVDHRLSGRLACHHCGHAEPSPSACPECGETDCLVACGPGVERIADEVAALMPEARRAIVTSDTIWSPEKAAEFVAQVEARAIDVIIGTQLVTKGYHFPDLTLVGVIDADIGLEGGDLRAGERTFQQIAQVAGRAGRAAKPGEVFIQTRHPEAPVIDALVQGDREAFYAAETQARREANVPPFGRLAAIIISSEDHAEAHEAARQAGAVAPEHDGFAVYGPAPAPLSLLRGRHRFRLLVHARRNVEMQRIIREWLQPMRWAPGVRVAVDVDPYSFV